MLDSGGGSSVGGWWWIGLVMTWMAGMQWSSLKTMVLCGFRSFPWWLVRFGE